MNLAAIEAGLLRALETTVWGALVAGMQASLPLLNATATTVDWNAVAHTFLVAMLVATLSGVRSYHVAVGAGAGMDTPVAPVASTAPITPVASSEPSAGE